MSSAIDRTDPSSRSRDRAIKYPGRFPSWWAAVTDARSGCLPQNGNTPHVEVIAAAARARIVAIRCRTRDQLAELATTRRGLKDELKAADEAVTDAVALLQGLPTRPAQEDLPDRPLVANPVLVKSLQRATAGRDLERKRAAAEHSLRNHMAHRDELVARIGQLDERIKQLTVGLPEATRRVVTAADARVARYAAVLRRWHRHRDELDPLLPFPRLSDRSDLFLDLAFVAPSLDE